MTLAELKKQVLTMIEEYDDSDDTLTADEDIALKLNHVINMVQNELIRYKKIPRYLELEVEKDQTITLDDIGEELGRNIYQLGTIRGSEYEYKADGTIIKALEDGKLEIECYIYPVKIDENTTDDYEFELSNDLLEIMPYGVAGDVLKSDIANAYGNIYSQKYENLKQSLDIRYNSGSIEFVGGVDI